MPTLDQIDRASQQNDHWLFIAALVVLGVVLLAIWRWMVAYLEKQGNRLTQITDRHIESCERLGEVVATNTAVLNEVKKKL
ncbi:MAG TPA: hypothetical protein VK731_09535 [Candidatus Cybelea sp.]|jgi:hypothetical protein|nr:hypothetical protein [Candidatus Cybelea sp.]